MPNLDANLTALRGKHECDWYLAAFTGSVVLTGAVTADAADGATSLAYTTSTGAYTAVKRGFLIRVSTSGGALKGFWRVRASGTLSATAMPITELSAGSVDINSGDLIEVRDVILPGAKVVEADANFRPDGLAVSTNNSAIPPIANAGPHWCGFVDSGETYATVAFVGSLSYAVDADSGGTVTYSWTAPTATGTTSSSSANPSFTFEAGEHLVTLTVTDSSNSASWVTYRKVRVYSDAAMPWEVVVESIESDVEQGTSATFRIFEDGALADVPDGSLVCLFAREYVNGTEQSFGNLVSSRSHMKALGYLRRDSSAANAEDGTAELRFEIVSPMQFYREFVTGYSKVILHNTSADAWDELDDLSVRRMLIQIPRWYTWLTEFHDLVFHSSFDDRDYAAFYIQRSNPIDQMDELAKGVDARITCDRAGRVELQMLPYAIAEGSRSGITTWGTFTDDDRRDYSFDREHWRTIEMVEGRGFTAGTSGNQPIFSRWPGTAPGSGSSSENVERLIADSQSDLNTRLGRLAAWRDGVYFTSTGVLHRALTGETLFPGPYWFDPAYCEYLLQDFAADTNLRGIDPADHRFIITRVSSTPDNERGTVEHSVAWRTATNGPAGVTYIPPQEEDNGLIPWTPPSWDFGGFPITPITDIPTGLTKGTGNIAIFLTGGVAVTTDWTTPEGAGGPTYIFYDGNGDLGISGFISDAVPDPYSPGYVGGGTEVNAWIATTTEIGYLTDIFGTPSYSVQHTFTNNTVVVHHRSIQTERALQNFVVVVSYYGPDDGSAGTTAIVTTDGSTWGSETTLTSFYSTIFTFSPGNYVSGHESGAAYATAMTDSGATPAFSLYKYTIGSGVWTLVSTSSINVTGFGHPGTLHIPWDQANDLIQYYGSIQGASSPPSSQKLYRANGASRADITPTVSATPYVPRLNHMIDSDPNNRLRVLCVGLYENGLSTDPTAVFTSLDGGTTWLNVVAPIFSPNRYLAGKIGGDGQTLYLLGENGNIAYSPDFGLTIEDKTGNMASLSTARMINIIGG